MYGEDEQDIEDEATTATPEPPVNSTPAGEVTATIAREEIVGLVADRFYAQLVRRDVDLDKAVNGTLRRMVRERAGDAVSAVTEEAVRAAAAEMIAEGWPLTDQYGKEKGRQKVKDVVIETLLKREYDRTPAMEKWVKEIFAAEIRGELAPMIEEAKKQLRKLLDETFSDALRKALMSGAGIR